MTRHTTIAGRNASPFRSLRAALAAALLGGLLLTPPALAHAAEPAFPDARDHWAAEAIAWAAETGVATGYEDGSFRPNLTIGEREFLAMLMRAYPELQTAPQPDEPWYKTYYDKAAELNWPVGADDFRRGDAARLIAAANGLGLAEDDAVRWLLAEGLSSGKSAPTPEGFAAADPLTRAEALTFIRRQKSYLPQLPQTPQLAGEQDEAAVALRGVTVGSDAAALADRLGEPDRIDPAGDGTAWHVYSGDYDAFAMFAVKDGKVAGLYSNAGAWSGASGAQIGIDADEALQLLQTSASGRIERANEVYYLTAGKLVYTLFVDRLDGGKLAGMLVMASDAAAGAADVEPSSLERQLFDLANAERVRFGLTPFEWDDKAADAARKHSEDMGSNGYFGHENLRGESPFDRMKSSGVDYRMAAENIAAGYPDAFHVHTGWMNSQGHRVNVLSDDLERLGVGVYAGGESELYYTQNFYTPA